MDSLDPRVSLEVSPGAAFIAARNATTEKRQEQLTELRGTAHKSMFVKSSVLQSDSKVGAFVQKALIPTEPKEKKSLLGDTVLHLSPVAKAGNKVKEVLTKEIDLIDKAGSTVYKKVDAVLTPKMGPAGRAIAIALAAITKVALGALAAIANIAAVVLAGAAAITAGVLYIAGNIITVGALNLAVKDQLMDKPYREAVKCLAAERTVPSGAGRL
jgi:hypothetical protein